MYTKRKMCCLIATCSLLVCMFRAEIFAKGNEQQELPEIIRWEEGRGFDEQGEQIVGSWAYDTVNVEGKRACGIMLSGESGYIIYHTLAQKMRWAKKMERSMRSFVERECMKAGALKRIDAVIMGDTIEFLVELLESDGGIKGNLFQVDDIYENYYYIPTIESAKIQVKLLTDKEKQIGLYRFLCGILEQPGTREYQVSAGTDQTGNPVYFCYELELRHLLRVKQELGWKKQGTILCFSYQKSILEYYFGKEVSYREILTEKVMEYLEGL